jgi:hypothetical protein
MTAFFTLIALGVSTTVPVAGGEVTPAGGAVPATAMVTAPFAEADGSAPIAEADGSTPVVEADGSVPTSSRLGSGEAGGLQMDTVSMQQCRYLMIQQGNTFIPRGLDFLRFPFAHNPTTLRDQRQSFGQLHGWSGGVVPSRRPLGFPFHQGALAFRGLAARQCFGCTSSFCLCRDAGKKVVAEPPELFQLNCASHRYTADNNSMHFKRNNPLVCRVSTRYNQGSTGSKQVYLA